MVEGNYKWVYRTRRSGCVDVTVEELHLLEEPKGERIAHMVFYRRRTGDAIGRIDPRSIIIITVPEVDQSRLHEEVLEVPGITGWDALDLMPALRCMRPQSYMNGLLKGVRTYTSHGWSTEDIHRRWLRGDAVDRGRLGSLD